MPEINTYSYLVFFQFETTILVGTKVLHYVALCCIIYHYTIVKITIFLTINNGVQDTKFYNKLICYIL